MSYEERLSADPKVMLGKPVIKHTRLSVDLILERLAEGMSIQDLLEAYPGISKEDIQACLSYSSDIESKEITVAG
ncbi:DUF433 domain-containing protein [Leptospira sarikeiensis]|uniref:DUF433 domain-containing protein n=1 Tax=Leptospira sarikeiensis TaxID=2484943 RepID=A0A4R9JZY6_9LEPT|nr:DUF433 domain-containing protein [Leptospira sarikeiensis]TGL58314.1 DUF433 domain-containing protein [Leptospira sarikeiensis]